MNLEISSKEIRLHLETHFLFSDYPGFPTTTLLASSGEVKVLDNLYSQGAQKPQMVLPFLEGISLRDHGQCHIFSRLEGSSLKS